jgi:hypothetical protein
MTASGHGTYYSVLHGPYSGYSSWIPGTATYLMEEGSLLEGKRHRAAAVVPSERSARLSTLAHQHVLLAPIKLVAWSSSACAGQANVNR